MKIKKFGSTEQIVYGLALPIAEKLGSSIWDVRFEKEGSNWYLRVFIDRQEGVTIDDCEALSRPLSDILDEEDPISQGYFLEVGSAGIERELIRQSHFEAALEKTITLKLYKALDGSKEITGKLKAFDKEKLSLAFPFGDDTGEVRILALADISGARLTEDTGEYL